jgi:hypothetical protein
MSSLASLEKKLARIESQLEKVRGCSPMTHGWQTSAYAKASRKWDVLAQEKFKITQIIDELKSQY